MLSLKLFSVSVFFQEVRLMQKFQSKKERKSNISVDFEGLTLTVAYVNSTAGDQ